MIKEFIYAGIGLFILYYFVYFYFYARAIKKFKVNVRQELNDVLNKPEFRVKRRYE